MTRRAVESVASGVWKFRLGVPEPHAPSGLRSFAPETRALAAMAPAGDCPVSWDEVRFRTSARGCVVELSMSADEDVYGLGLQLKSVRQTGRKKTLRVNSDPTADLGDSHAPVPFLVSTRGWAILVDTLRYMTHNVQPWHQELRLLPVGLPYLIKALEGTRIPGLHAYPLPGHRRHSVVKHQVHHQRIRRP